MGSRSRIKFAVCEVLQFAAFCVPLFIVMQRFAAILSQAKSLWQPSGGDSHTAYWLIVASSVAYVTTVALLVWLPMKYMVFMKKKTLVGRKKWRPVALAYVLLSTLPSFAFLIASSEVQIRNNLRLDTFTEVPVSLVLFSLICIDIVERIRHCRLTGQANELHRDADIPTLNQVETVTPIVNNGNGPSPSATTATPQNTTETASGDILRLTGNVTAKVLTGKGTVTGLAATGAVSGISPDTSLPLRNFPFVPAYTGPLRFLLASDARAEVFADSFLYWLDTAELLRVTNHKPVYFSGWTLPVYLFSFLSMLRVALMPHTPILSPLGVALQDLPFLFLRVALLAIFGFVTPVLFVLKNILVCLSYIYFNFMTRLKVFNTERMF